MRYIKRESHPEMRTPPGAGAALISGFVADENERYHNTVRVLSFQELWPILERHWFRDGEWRVVA